MPSCSKERLNGPVFLPNILASFFMALNHRLNKPRHWESLHLGVLIPVFPLHTSVNAIETAVISEAVPTIPYNILYTARVNNMTH